jgi:hypothetical protein
MFALGIILMVLGVFGIGYSIWAQCSEDGQEAIRLRVELFGPVCGLFKVYLNPSDPRSLDTHEYTHLVMGAPWICMLSQNLILPTLLLMGHGFWISIFMGICFKIAIHWVVEIIADVAAYIRHGNQYIRDLYLLYQKYPISTLGMLFTHPPYRLLFLL